MNLKPTLIGDLCCQRESFKRTFTSRIVNVSPCLESQFAELNLNEPDQNEAQGVIAVVTLEDTVLFPEGGGQLADRGTMAGYPVVDVQRCGVIAQHYVRLPSLDLLEVGQEVELEVNWTRRWDATLQHSGQHLISAIAAQSPFYWATEAWYEGPITLFVIEKDTIIKAPTNC
jgi:misacylated tRNA(Ala) deacylase